MDYWDIIDKARDHRGLEQFKDDIKRGCHNGRLAMSGYCAWLFATTRLFHSFEYFEERFWKDMDEVGLNQDANLEYPDGTVIPYSVKTTKFDDVPNPFPMRYYETKHIIDMDGNILISNKKEFIVFPAKLMWKYPVDKYERWNDKQCFFLNTNDFEWERHLVDLKFI